MKLIDLNLGGKGLLFDATMKAKTLNDLINSSISLMVAVLGKQTALIFKKVSLTEVWGDAMPYNRPYLANNENNKFSL